MQFPPFLCSTGATYLDQAQNPFSIFYGGQLRLRNGDMSDGDSLTDDNNEAGCTITESEGDEQDGEGRGTVTETPELSQMLQVTQPLT